MPTVSPYAGIGSRQTPREVLDLFVSLGYWFGAWGLTLRSGAAPGADSAFERGAVQSRSRMEIFLPWRGFGGRAAGAGRVVVADAGVLAEAERLAREFHPAWHRCSDAARKLHTRNVFQVMGADLKSPSLFVVCWTPGGAGTGGTGQAIRLAAANDIPVFDLAIPTRYNDLLRFTQCYQRRYEAAAPPVLTNR